MKYIAHVVVVVQRLRAHLNCTYMTVVHDGISFLTRVAALACRCLPSVTALAFGVVQGLASDNVKYPVDKIERTHPANTSSPPVEGGGTDYGCAKNLSSRVQHS